jgi:hypothetical protein
MDASRAPYETNVRHRRSGRSHCSCQCRVLGYRPRRGDKTVRARDEDDYAADIVATDFAAGRINVGAHDSDDDGDSAHNKATECSTCNTGRHFVELDHASDHGGTGHRWSQRWQTAALAWHAHS